MHGLEKAGSLASCCCCTALPKSHRASSVGVWHAELPRLHGSPQWVFAVHLDSGNADKWMSKEKATKGIWTLALTYGLEVGVIKQLRPGFQMRNLVCDLWTQGNEHICFSCDVETPLKQFLDLFRGKESVEGGFRELMFLSGSGQVLTQNTAAFLWVADWMLTFTVAQ